MLKITYTWNSQLSLIYRLHFYIAENVSVIFKPLFSPTALGSFLKFHVMYII